MKSIMQVWPLAAQYSLCAYIMASCQSYEPYSEEEVFRGAYTRNFIKTFGEIDPSQDWDFTNDATPKSSGDLSAMTKAEPDACNVVFDTYEGNIFFDNKLSDRTDLDTKTDRSFAFEIGEDACFSIFPVYQASVNVSGFRFGLQVFVDDEHITKNYSEYGWLMGTDMFYKNMRNGPFVAIGDKACNSWGTKSKSILHYHNNGSKKIMYMNLVVTDQSNYVEACKFAPFGTQQSSLNYQMRIIDIPKPDNIDDRFDVLFVGCEIAYFDPDYSKKYYTAKRYRSLVLMIVGPKIPKVVYLEKNQNDQLCVPVKLSKRYMVEDMGSSSDFDFNDIVVDVERVEERPVVVSQKVVSTYYNALQTTVSLAPCAEEQTTATIRHLCGTKPFQVSVGDYSFETVIDPTNPVYVNKTATIEGWQPDLNNISVQVWRNDDEITKGGWIVQFPSVGNVPFIMALPVDVGWTEEGTIFTEWKKYLLH